MDTHNKQPNFKPLDFIRHEYLDYHGVVRAEFGIIKEGRETFSVEWFGKCQLKTAWWSLNDLNNDRDKTEVVGNLANFLAVNLCHPFGSGRSYAEEIYPFGK